ncbi:hypothetical protein Bca52824_081747 [Brassica carinata]|uniref:Uncharacterized protein n=1 Tax=Brassica carinata TaxID=52824 RepID=A0A8X7TS78_BRACI|nr:hypothetical protein Bca52824_081747 [Brassica carinata]
MPPVKDLIFKDPYVDAARTKVLSDGSMNYVVDMYDTALKETISKLKQADKLVRAKDTALNRKTSEFKAMIDKAAVEQSQLLEEKKAQKEKFVDKFGDLKGKHLKEINRLRDSRSYEVTHERVRVQMAMIVKFNKRFTEIRNLETRRSDFEMARSLQSQAFGTEPTGRDLEGLPVQEQGNVSEVEGTEDTSGPTTAPAVPNSASAPVNLTVREESSAPTLGVSDEDPTLPLGEDGAGLDPEDLVEPSVSSAEEDGGDKSNEQAPASKPQGAEEDLGESSAQEQGNVDEVENPTDSTADGTGGISDPLGAQVIRENLDRAED